jgi:raffinose/stachyose/melibiose transport system substrate-binding protein
MRKRWLAVSLAVITALGSLTACSKSDDTTVETTAESTASGDKDVVESSTSSAESVEVEFLSQKREDVDLFDEILADFMEKNPGIQISQTTTTGSVSFSSRVASNDVPELGHVYASTAYRTMAEEGLFLDLNGQDFLERIPKEYIDLFTLEDGSVFAVPVNINAFGLYVNMDIYEEQGLELPKTYDELIANCEKLKAAGITPFAFQFKDAGALRQCFERYMSGVVDHDFLKICEEVGLEGKSFGDYSSMVEGLEKFIALLDYADTDPLGMDTNDLADSFANGKCAMVMNGNWGASQYLGLNPDLNMKVILFPSVTGIDSTTVGTPDMCLAVSAAASAEQQEACLAFIRYFLEPETIEWFAKEDKVPSIVEGVAYRNEELKDISDAIENGQFTKSPTLGWANGYQSTIQGELQSLIVDRDVKAFIETWDQFTKDVYAQQ